VLATFGTYTAIGAAAALIPETCARARARLLDRARPGLPATGPEPLEVPGPDRQVGTNPACWGFGYVRPEWGPHRQNGGQELNCVTCGDQILPERAELGFKYCTRRKCVHENREGLTVLEIGQHKTNAEYVILGGASGEQALKDMREGKYRRDPVVVKRESQRTHFDVPKRQFSQPRIKKYPAGKVKFVQALHDQGYGVEDILEKGAYMNLTRSELVRYMSGHRPRSARG
jgi:hypothetical protein